MLREVIREQARQLRLIYVRRKTELLSAKDKWMGECYSELPSDKNARVVRHPLIVRFRRLARTTL